MKSYAYTQMYALEDYHFWYIGKRFFLASALKHLPPGKILDIGSGTGGTTEFLSRFGHVMGVEQHPLALKLSRARGLHVLHASAHNIPLPSKTVKIVTFCDVLYHKNIHEKRALQEAYRLLAPGGSIVITDCAIPSLWSRHDIVNEGKYRFTKKKLTQIVRDVGFRIHYCHYIFSSIFPIMMVIRLFAPEGPNFKPASRLNRLLSLILRLEAAVPHWVPRTWGSSLLLVAQKPSDKSGKP